MTLAPYAPPAEALAARTEANLPRNPFVAAALSILVPGAGQLYNGRFVRGAIVYSAMLLLVLLLRGGFLAQDAWELLGVLSILLVVHLAAAVGASVWGLRHGSTRHRLVHRWFLFVPLVVALAILPWTAPAPLASQRPMKIPFRSMQPTIRPGELVLVDWTYYHHHAPQRGDLAVFRSPHDEKRLLKRVIGLAGERIETSGGRATVEGDAAADRWAYLDGPSLDLSFSGVVPEGAVFVLGDFRHNSRDSRSFGYVSDGRLVGRAISIYASEDPNRIGLLLED